MATLLFNNIEQDVKFLNALNIDLVFKNLVNENHDIFKQENYDYIEINDNYNYRPDRVAYDVYKVDLYYPIILASNNIGSIIEFTTDRLGHKIYYLKEEFLPKLKLNI